MTRFLPAAAAKAHFAECVRATERGDQVVITRHGHPVAALVSADALRALAATRGAASGGLATLAGGWPGAEALAAAAEGVQRSRTVPRSPR